MNWSDLDWAALDRLRDGFLGGGAAQGAYWKSASDLASYDFTYGERIGWKWDQVLRELRLRGWSPSSRTVLDWGCGSGVAARRVIGAFGRDHFDALQLWDHSPAATEFAATAAATAFPGLAVETVTPGFLASDASLGLLIMSHVLNELSPEALEQLRSLARRAAAVIWVEPGTHDASRRLSAIRDEFSQSHAIVAPCTHQHACPVLAAGRERDWCHFFAPPPPGLFADSDWVKFGQRAGIDLRSLPYSFFAADRSPATATRAGWSRIIGRPEFFKPYARFLNCDETGLAELTLPKRTDPAFYKALDRTKEPLVYRWRREGDTIVEVLAADSSD